MLYFFDEDQIIVCSNAFWKKTDRAPPSELKCIDDTMAAYAADKENGRLEIRPWKPSEDKE